MKAVTIPRAGEVAVEDRPEPKIGDPRDVIVRVTATAICGVDLLAYHGLVPGFEYGTTMGHEFVGVVTDVGSAAWGVEPGSRVVCNSMISCGQCESCRANRPTQCGSRSLFGFSGTYPRLEGGQAEFVRVPYADRVLYPVPEKVSDEAAVFVADILSTGMTAVRRSGVRTGDTVVVVGCGPVGLMAALSARGLASKLIAVDPLATRREAAASLGIDVCDPDEARSAVETATGGAGADVVIEAAGSQAAVGLAIELTRGRGHVAVIGAHFEPDLPVNAGAMFERELQLGFVVGDPTNERKPLLDLLAAGRIDPLPVMSHRLPLTSAAEGFSLFDTRAATKVVLTP